MEIKPLEKCPFCGSKVSMFISTTAYGKLHQIGCKKCGMLYTNNNAKYSETATITAFNRRAKDGVNPIVRADSNGDTGNSDI